MRKNTTYNILVVSDQDAQYRQFRVSKRAILLSLFTLIVVLGLLGTGSAIHLDEFPYKQDELNQLRQENDVLKLANDRYLKASIEMEEKLRLFEEKTTKLAQFVGVEPNMDDGVGGPVFQENELNPYLRHDLGLLQQKTQRLEDRFADLEVAYQEKSDRLDATPSLLPARGWISSGYKYRTDPFTKKKTFHPGIDISCPEGTPVYAPANGVVSFKGYQGGFGNMLEISHGNGLKTRYGHLYKFNISKGQRIKRGDLIGYVGNTGRSTASHLHYEIHKDKKSINPMKYIIRDAKKF